MYLFDTDTICNVFKKRPSKTLLDHIEHLDSDQQFLSTITIFEIVYGARKSDHPEKHLRNLDKILLPSLHILEFDLQAVYMAGHICAGLEQAGQTLSLPDIQPNSFHRYC